MKDVKYTHRPLTDLLGYGLEATGGYGNLRNTAIGRWRMQMKKCPYCAEDIQDAAIKCKHCGEFLNGAIRIPPAQPQAESGVPWYCRTSSIVVTLLCVPPFALPLIWLHPTMKPVPKAIWTLVTLALTAGTVYSIIQLMQIFDQLNALMKSF